MADFGTIGAGAAVAGISIPMILKPEKQYRYSRQIRNARIAELDGGSPEVFFEERRELEAYTPKTNASVAQMRLIGVALFLCGLALAVWGYVE